MQLWYLVTNWGRGLLMGTADIVPGVSGGTVALLLGIYQRLISQIQFAARAGALLLTGRWQSSREYFQRLEPAFLLGLLAGIASSVLLLASVMRQLIDEYPVPVSAAFFGLVAASVIAVRVRVSSWRPLMPKLAFVVAGAVTFIALGFRGETTEQPSAVVLFAAGAVAICAMILPGISGALLLLLLGLYDAIIDAVSDRDLAAAAIFIAGAAFGLALFSNLLGVLLRRYYDVTLAALMGLMAGSLRVLWPWPSDAVVDSAVDGAVGGAAGSAERSGLENAALGAPVADEVALAVSLAVVAFVVVLVLGRAASRRHYGAKQNA